MKIVLLVMVLVNVAFSDEAEIFDAYCTDILTPDDCSVVLDIAREIYDAPIVRVGCQLAFACPRVSVHYEDEVDGTYVQRKSVSFVKLLPHMVDSQLRLYQDQPTKGWYAFKKPMRIREYRSFMVLDQVVIARLVNGATYEEASRILQAVDSGDVVGFDEFGIRNVDITSVHSIERSQIDSRGGAYEVWYGGDEHGWSKGLILEGYGDDYEMVAAGHCGP